MDELIFASTKEAIQYLSDATNSRVKIAWEDQSTQLVKDIVEEAKKSPAIFYRMRKLYDFDNLKNKKPEEKILPTNKGGLKLVEEISPDLVDEMAEVVSGVKDQAGKGKIIDFATENKKYFPEFHQKHKKGIQKDDSGPYYRSKAGLMKRGLEYLKGEGKGEKNKREEQLEKGKEDVRKMQEKQTSEREKKIRQKRLKPFVNAARKSITRLLKNHDHPIKDLFEQIFLNPDNKSIRDEFAREFDDEIKAGSINDDLAYTYLQIIKTFADRVKKELKDDFPEFVENINKLFNSMKQDATQAVDVKVDEVKPEEQQKAGFFNQQPNASDKNRLNNVINSLVKIMQSKK